MSKHFAHKISVVEDEGEGRFALPPGPASARADQTGLTLRAEAADAEGLSRSMFISKDICSASPSARRPPR